MIFKPVFVCLLCFAFYSLSSQVVKRNKDGLKIVEFEDGTWRYYEIGDSNLVAIDQNIDTEGPRILQGKQSIVATKIEIYNRDILIEFQHLISEEKELQKLVEVLQQQIKEAQSDKDKDYLKSLLNQLKDVLKQQKIQKKKVQKIEKKYNFAKQLRRAKSPYQSRWLAKHEKKNGVIHIPTSPVSLPQEASSEVDTLHNNSDTSLRLNKQLPTADREEIFITNQFVPFIEESIPCEFQFNGVDPFTQKRKVEIKSNVLFQYTPEELMSFLKDKPYITCEAHVSSTPGFKFLTLRFIISSDRAKQSFGRLSQGSSLSIRLIDGSIINMFNRTTDEGVVDFDTKTTIYSGSYIISRKDEKALLNKELDRLRVVWTSGFEEYEIYNLDFLKDQLNCLNNY